MQYTKIELESLETIEQAWDGDELKIKEDDYKVWLTHPENRAYNRDYTIEVLILGSWEQSNHSF